MSALFAHFQNAKGDIYVQCISYFSIAHGERNDVTIHMIWPNKQQGPKNDHTEEVCIMHYVRTTEVISFTYYPRVWTHRNCSLTYYPRVWTHRNCSIDDNYRCGHLWTQPHNHLENGHLWTRGKFVALTNFCLKLVQYVKAPECLSKESGFLAATQPPEDCPSRPKRITSEATLGQEPTSGKEPTSGQQASLHQDRPMKLGSLQPSHFNLAWSSTCSNLQSIVGSVVRDCPKQKDKSAPTYEWILHSSDLVKHIHSGFERQGTKKTYTLPTSVSYQGSLCSHYLMRTCIIRITYWQSSSDGGPYYK